MLVAAEGDSPATDAPAQENVADSAPQKSSLPLIPRPSPWRRRVRRRPPPRSGATGVVR